jgi:hypothetical protein
MEHIVHICSITIATLIVLLTTMVLRMENVLDVMLTAIPAMDQGIINALHVKLI